MQITKLIPVTIEVDGEDTEKCSWNCMHHCECVSTYRVRTLECKLKVHTMSMSMSYFLPEECPGLQRTAYCKQTFPVVAENATTVPLSDAEREYMARTLLKKASGAEMYGCPSCMEFRLLGGDSFCPNCGKYVGGYRYHDKMPNG